MKYIFTALLLPVFLTAAAQDTSFNTLNAALCQCTFLGGAVNFFKQTSQTGPVSQCMQKAVQDNIAVLYAAAQKKYGAAAQDSMQVFVETLFTHQLIKAMVYTCDNFVKLIDTARFYDDYSGNSDSLKKVVVQYNKMDRSLNGNFYYHRGMAYMHLREYKKAFADADSAIADKPKDGRSWELEAWSLELRHRYDDALAAYKKMETIENPKDEGKQLEYQIIVYLMDSKKQRDGK